MTSPKEFVFEAYSYKPDSGEAVFTYSYDNGLEFQETLLLPKELWSFEMTEVIDRILFSLHILLGISYWKAHAVPKLTVRSGTLNPAQATFWNQVYTKGLGEFFYENQIDFRNLVNFPSSDIIIESQAHPTSETALVLLGGGKDSLMSIMLLQKMQCEFETYSLGAHPMIDHQVQKFELQHTTIRRRMDPKLFELNEKGAYNGHVPISTVFAFTGLLLAAIKGNRYVIASNEQSANEGNVEYQGEEINHQWSKSFEFEKMLHDYVHQWITNDITYFSLLRPLHEIRIAEWIGEHINVVPSFVSCNSGFRVQHVEQQSWCGVCAKCLFVFIILAPFVPRANLEKRFGKNLLDDASLLPLFQELLGHRRVKPFDCVGTPEEVVVATVMIKEAGNYSDSALMHYAMEHVLPSEEQLEKMKTHVFGLSSEHAVPKSFQEYFYEVGL